MKKVLITLLAAALSLTMCVSTTASAYTFTNIDQLVNFKEKVPMQVQPLDDSVKDEIVQKLLQSDFNGSNADDIVVTYYGSLDGGKMLINSYDKTREYTTDEEADIITSICGSSYRALTISILHTVILRITPDRSVM